MRRNHSLNISGEKTLASKVNICSSVKTIDCNRQSNIKKIMFGWQHLIEFKRTPDTYFKTITISWENLSCPIIAVTHPNPLFFPLACGSIPEILKISDYFHLHLNKFISISDFYNTRHQSRTVVILHSAWSMPSQKEKNSLGFLFLAVTLGNLSK